MAVDFVGGLFIPSALIIFLLFCSGVQDGKTQNNFLAFLL